MDSVAIVSNSSDLDKSVPRQSLTTIQENSCDRDQSAPTQSLTTLPEKSSYDREESVPTICLTTLPENSSQIKLPTVVVQERPLSAGQRTPCPSPTFPISEEPLWPTDWRAWTCLFGCFLLMFNSWGLVNSYGSFASYYAQHLMADRGTVLLYLVGSTESFVVLILSFATGRFLDAGFSRQLIGIGAFLVTLGLFLLSLASGDAQYLEGNYGVVWLTQGFVMGLGMACFFVSSSQIAATWFHRRKSLAIGIVASGASISGLVYPVMFKSLLESFGFANSVRVVAGLAGVTALISFLFAVPNSEHQFRRPENWWRMEVWVDKGALEHSGYCWFVAAISFMFLGFYAVFFSIEEWAAEMGFGIRDNISGAVVQLGSDELHDDAIRTFWLLSIMNVCSTTGRVGSAWLSDHYDAIAVHSAATILASLLVLCLWTIADRVNHAIAFVILFGVFSGSVIGLPPASVAYILGPNRTKQTKLGQWTGMMYTVAAIPALIGPVIAGYLISHYQKWLTIQLWSGTCLMISGMCMLMSKIFSDKEKKLEKRKRKKGSAGKARKTLSSATTVTDSVLREQDEDVERGEVQQSREK